jgi:hypothetical protein
LDYYARHLSAHEPNGSFVAGFSSLPCPGTTDVGDGSLFPHVAVQADDRILIAAGHIVERRASDGLYEASYSTSTSNVVTDILIQPDGRILTVEVVSSGGVDRARLVRRLP